MRIRFAGMGRMTLYDLMGSAEASAWPIGEVRDIDDRLARWLLETHGAGFALVDPPAPSGPGLTGKPVKARARTRKKAPK